MNFSLLEFIRNLLKIEIIFKLKICLHLTILTKVFSINEMK